MGLMLADHDLDVEPDDLLEDLESCRCEHTAGDHTPDGCRASGCLCPATWDGLGAEILDDDEERVVARVVAFLKAARARRRKIEQDREAAIAKDPASAPRSNKPRVTRKLKAPKKAPRAAVATAKPRAPVRKVAPSSPLLVEHSRAAWQDEASELLEAVGVLS